MDLSNKDKKQKQPAVAGIGGSRAPSQQSNLNGGNSIISNSEK